MKVYILVKKHSYTESEILDVFDSIDKAYTTRDVLSRYVHDTGTEFLILEMEVN